MASIDPSSRSPSSDSSSEKKKVNRHSRSTSLGRSVSETTGSKLDVSGLLKKKERGNSPRNFDSQTKKYTPNLGKISEDEEAPIDKEEDIPMNKPSEEKAAAPKPKQRPMSMPPARPTPTVIPSKKNDDRQL